MEVGARPRSILDQTIGGRSTLFLLIQYNRGKDRTVPYRDNRNSQRILRALGIPLPCVFLVAGTEQQGKTRPTCPGLEGEPYESESKGFRFRSWFGGFRAPLDLFSYKGRGKESKSMDINEPSLMDVAHDTINSTQGPALIEVAYSPSSEGKGQGFFRSKSGRVS